MCRSLSRLAADATLVGTYPTTPSAARNHPDPGAAKPRRRFRLWPRRR